MGELVAASGGWFGHECPTAAEEAELAQVVQLLLSQREAEAVDHADDREVVLGAVLQQTAPCASCAARAPTPSSTACASQQNPEHNERQNERSKRDQEPKFRFCEHHALPQGKAWPVFSRRTPSLLVVVAIAWVPPAVCKTALLVQNTLDPGLGPLELFGPLPLSVGHRDDDQSRRQSREQDQPHEVIHKGA